MLKVSRRGISYREKVYFYEKDLKIFIIREISIMLTQKVERNYFLLTTTKCQFQMCLGYLINSHNSAES